MLNRTLALIALVLSPLALAGELTQNSELVQTCGACHGVDGNTLLPIAPNLAGQVPGYLLYELNAYKSHNRMDEFMGAFVDPLTDEDISRLVAYYTRQKFVPFTPAEQADPVLLAQGALLYRREVKKVGLSCADCHGEYAEGVENRVLLKDFPRLAGQPYDYLFANLKQYSQRMKHFSMLGMKVAAASLSDDEIKALATYLSNLK